MKSKAIVALVVYVIGSIGITINYHYCGGHLVDLAFYHFDEANCCGDVEEEDHNCCSDEYLVIDTDDSEGLVAFKCSQKCNAQLAFNLHSITPVFQIQKVDYHEFLIPHDHGPPLSTRPPSFILNHVLII